MPRRRVSGRWHMGCMSLASRWARTLTCALTCALTSAGIAAGAQPPPRATTPPATAATADSLQSPRPTLRAGFLVRPDTVTVGEPFTLVVSIEVPNGATVQWPSITDSTAIVAMRAPTRVMSEVRGEVRRETAEYALAAWNVGILPIGLADASVRLASGIVPVPLRAARVVVRTVLPGDTSLHVPKPARAPFPLVVPWWEQWWPALLVAAVLAALWWTWRRWRRRRAPVVTSKPLDVFARAMHDFERLEKLALVDAGERGRAAALAVEVARTYLAARNPTATLAHTTSGLLAAITDDARIPHDRLASLLHDVDRIKFARDGVSALRANALHREARVVVELVESAERARQQARQDALREAERAERSTRNADEDRSRRAARRSTKGPPAGVS